MDWFIDIFKGTGVIHSCVIISLVSLLGIALGKLKLFGISLGVSFVFFIGLVAGHFGMLLDPTISEFIQSFGLSLFVFSLGMQVGPSFFSSIRSGGLSLNLLSILVIAINIVMVIIISTTASIPMNEMVGILSGATTNTPALGAAQQSLAQMGGATNNELYDMAYACAVTYPFGVIGAIIAIIALNGMFKNKVDKMAVSAIDEQVAKSNPIIVGVVVSNRDFYGKKVKELQKLTESKLIVTRILRDDKELITLADSTVMRNDSLLITVCETDKDRVINLIGEEKDIKWDTLQSELVSRKIFVTKTEINGKSIEDLEIRKNYNVNITRVNRAGIFLIASNDLKLFVGDRVILVGEQKSVTLVENLLGNSMNKIDEPHLFTIFTGIVLGLVLGSIPFAIPGISTPIKMGLAGGTIIMGILMGAFGYKFKFNTYTTMSANLMLRELGIILYLSALGISSGEGFVDSLVSGAGVEWLVYGALITVVPVFIVGFIAIKLMKKDIPSVFGMLCGSMANPSALSCTTEILGKASPTISYATVYPLTMFLRVVSAQILIMFFV